MNTLNEQRTILIIDGYHLLHKGYYGSLKRNKIALNREGTQINAIYTFIAKIIEIVKKNNYYTIIVAMDMDQGCWRKELYPEYKAKRKETPEALIPQKEIIREFLTLANIPWYEMPRYEADDIIGTINKIAVKLNYKVHVLSNDKDIFQLVSEKTQVITNISKHDDHILVNEKIVYEKFKCKPNQVWCMKALMGDPSDNIKGVRYLHFNQAVQLLQKYKDIDDIMANLHHLQPIVAKRLTENKEHVLLNARITKIQERLPIGRINFRPLRINWYGFNKFLKKHKMWAYVAQVNKIINNFQANKKDQF